MIIEVKVPSVGESITSGVISAWHKKSGDLVNEGEPLFALETDKVSTDIVAEKSGVLETKVPEGQEVKIGELIAVIDDSKGSPEDKKSAAATKNRKTPEKKKEEAEPQKKAATVAAGVDGGRPAATNQPARADSTPPATDLSPAVRRLLDEEKIEPDGIVGTGPGGRLTKTDVLKAIEDRGKAALLGQIDEVLHLGNGVLEPRRYHFEIGGVFCRQSQMHRHAVSRSMSAPTPESFSSRRSKPRSR